MAQISDNDNSRIRFFKSQYLQLVDPNYLSFPPPDVLIKPEVQTSIYQNLFNEDNSKFLPPLKYQTRVLKDLISRIEKAISNPDEDVRLSH